MRGAQTRIMTRSRKNNKKTPATAPKKLGSTKRKATDNMDGSIINSLPQTEAVSTAAASNQQPSATTSQAQQPNNQADAILAYLAKLDQANQTLTKRVSELEGAKSVVGHHDDPRLRGEREEIPEMFD